MVKVATLIFLSLLTRANETDCLPKVHNFVELYEFSSHVHDAVKKVVKPWSAATPKQIKNSVCRSSVPSLKEMEDSLASSKLQKVVALGNLKLQDEDPKLVSSLKKLIQANGKIAVDLKKYSSCKKALCVAKEVFGQELGTKLLYVIHKYGLNGSHLANDKARPWGAKEFDSYIQGVIDLPDFIFPINKNKQFIHSHGDDDSALANASITFFSGLDSHTHEEKSYTTFHELSHYISSELEISRSPQWLAAGNWETDLKKKYQIEEKRKEKDGGLSTLFSSIQTPKPKQEDGLPLKYTNIYTTKPALKTPNIFKEMSDRAYKDELFYKASVTSSPEQTISRYAQTNPSEDFAESMSAYRYNPIQFKKLSPKKYNFIKEKVFGGIEYTSKQKCKESNSEFANHLKSFTKWEKDNAHKGFSAPKKGPQKVFCFDVTKKECEAINKRRYLKDTYVDQLQLPAQKKELLKHTLKAYSQ